MTIQATPTASSVFRHREKTLLALIEAALDQLPEQQWIWLAGRCPRDLWPRAQRLLIAAKQAGDHGPVYCPRPNPGP